MFKKKAVLVSMALFISSSTFANVGELPGPETTSSSVTQSMTPKERAEYRKNRMAAYNQLVEKLGSSQRTADVFERLEAMQTMTLQEAVEHFLALYNSTGRAGDMLTVLEDINASIGAGDRRWVKPQVQFYLSVYPLTGRLDRSSEMLKISRELVAAKKAESFSDMLEIFKSLVSTTGSGSDALAAVLMASDISNNSSYLKFNLRSFVKFRSVSGRTDTSVAGMKLVQDLYKKELIETMSQGTQLLVDLMKQVGSSRTVIEEIVPALVANSHSQSSFYGQARVFTEVYSTSGRSDMGIKAVIISNTLMQKGLASSGIELSSMIKNLSSTNGSFWYTQDLLTFLSERCTDAEEFKAGVNLYLQSFSGGHESTMLRLKKIW